MPEVLRKSGQFYPAEPAIPSDLYLYLNDESHVEAWVSGGKIPIALASSYLGEREGTKTPDELLISWSNSKSVREEKALEELAKAFGVHDFWLEGVKIRTNEDEICLGSTRSIREVQDSLIICLTRSLSKQTAKRFSTIWNGEIVEKRAVVRISDIEHLATVIDEQLEARGVIGWVNYTSGNHRNAFLKGKLDSWQEEIRISWFTDDTECRWVDLPPGIAEQVPMDELPEVDEPPLERLLIPYDEQLRIIKRLSVVEI